MQINVNRDDGSNNGENIYLLKETFLTLVKVFLANFIDD